MYEYEGMKGVTKYAQIHKCDFYSGLKSQEWIN